MYAKCLISNAAGWFEMTLPAHRGNIAMVSVVHTTVDAANPLISGSFAGVVRSGTITLDGESQSYLDNCNEGDAYFCR